MEESKLSGEMMEIEPESKILQTNYYKKILKKELSRNNKLML